VQGRGNFNVFEALFAVGLLDNLRTITAAIRKTGI
jgi:hypothetical protein